MCSTSSKIRSVRLESKSIKKFKADLIKTIPFFPNNKETLEELSAQSISSILFHYIHWASRFIPQRKRKIIIDPHLTRDRRWKELKEKIENVLSVVRHGEDLTPYLSLKAHKKGYTPAERVRNGEADNWDDKDMLLNTMGFHHLHLGEKIKEGVADRTNEVIFAYISREKFRVMAIFDHSVFDSTQDENGKMNAERSRLWDIYTEYSSRGVDPGSVFISNPITTSGHPIHIHGITNQYTHVLNEIDPKITDRDFENEIYIETKLEKPKNNKFIWMMNNLDLGIIDKNNNYFVFRYGPI